MNISKYYTYERSVLINAPKIKIFEFHRDTNNLPEISPPFPKIKIISISEIPLQNDSVLIFQLNYILFKINWEIKITDFVFNERIADLQLRGPFIFWKHYHIFTSVDEGTIVTDRIDYILPFGIIGKVLHPLIKSQLSLVFKVRHNKTKSFFERN
jgi:ligand-binding SRPBCC domain-containing protein